MSSVLDDVFSGVNSEEQRASAVVVVDIVQVPKNFEAVGCSEDPLLVDDRPSTMVIVAHYADADLGDEERNSFSK